MPEMKLYIGVVSLVSVAVTKSRCLRRHKESMAHGPTPLRHDVSMSEHFNSLWYFPHAIIRRTPARLAESSATITTLWSTLMRSLIRKRKYSVKCLLQTSEMACLLVHPVHSHLYERTLALILNIRLDVSPSNKSHYRGRDVGSF